VFRPAFLITHLLLVLACLLGFPHRGAAADADPTTVLAQIRSAADRRDSGQVFELCGRLLSGESKTPEAYYWRGREQLRAGRATEAVADFNAFLAANPGASSRLWERGIACYYAGQYKEGAEQFAAYQTYDDNDVENAVWHVICQSRVSGFDDAQRQLMKVRRDGRVPMMQIFDMFAGKMTPEQVLQVAEDAAGDADEKKYHRFYAHLYIGLYEEARGSEAAARKHLTDAAERYPNDHYMWDVAHMHAQRWKQPAPAKSP